MSGGGRGAGSRCNFPNGGGIHISLVRIPPLVPEKEYYGPVFMDCWRQLNDMSLTRNNNNSFLLSLFSAYHLTILFVPFHKYTFYGFKVAERT